MGQELNKCICRKCSQEVYPIRTASTNMQFNNEQTRSDDIRVCAEFCLSIIGYKIRRPTF